MPAPPTKPRWGDDADEDSDDDLDQQYDTSKKSTIGIDSGGLLKIPPTHVSVVDSKGIKIVTSYRANPNKPGSSLIKTVTKIKVHVVKVREHVDVAVRRKWKKFGQAASGEDQSNVTVESRDDVYVEDPNADVDLQDEDVTKALAGNLNAFWEKQRLRQVERKYDIDSSDLMNKDAGPPGAGEVADGWHKVGDKAPGAPGTGNKYVPPSARGGVPAGPGAPKGGAGSLAAMAGRLGDKPDQRMQDNRDQNTIRVTNISEDTTEADLQELFGRFGRISRVYVAKDKETLQSRGFAFVSFTQREEAAKAMDKLQGYGYDHLILKLEWARPSAPKDSSTQYRSGYGQALAQDTKAKVSYASNLTR
eukprot:CAMPEP_0198248544 /NCGR_PEP_ID=MMETSP1447-20131203/292_1 /TAXON_ID=420782 /ORGANISM="Chaetoceros dichaeta, Strain CCMP1751" /LENGTH=361 /DNA_ID=CAMNT_0043932967 /DNA_START=122 /DNA_END=1207 /DNA_ORIENTATION=+